MFVSDYLMIMLFGKDVENVSQSRPSPPVGHCSHNIACVALGASWRCVAVSLDLCERCFMYIAAWQLETC